MTSSPRSTTVSRAGLLRTCLQAALLSGVVGAYAVKPGDTLYSLARTYRTTVAELGRLNGLSSTTLEVGQVLAGEDVRQPAEDMTPLPVGGKYIVLGRVVLG